MSETFLASTAYHNTGHEGCKVVNGCWQHSPQTVIDLLLCLFHLLVSLYFIHLLINGFENSSKQQLGYCVVSLAKVKKKKQGVNLCCLTHIHPNSTSPNQVPKSKHSYPAQNLESKKYNNLLVRQIFYKTFRHSNLSFFQQRKWKLVQASWCIAGTVK